MDWRNSNQIPSRSFTCGHCSNRVASAQGWFTNSAPPSLAAIHICPHCFKPSSFIGNTQLPGVAAGNQVEHLPQDIAALYEEARSSVAAGAHTGCVLICRKLLMNVAVAQGASPGESFLSYIEYLSNKSFIPPNGKSWVDHIRTKGNEATHEIHIMASNDAIELVAFAEMLLKFIFEFPARVPKSPTRQ